MKFIVLPFGDSDRFFFNIKGNVGPDSPNNLVDVQLVQFGYFAIAQNRLPNNEPELITAAGAVVIGAPYSGAPNDPLTDAIRVDQRVSGGTQDGHVSAIHSVDGSGLYDNTHFFLLVRLVNHIRLFVRDSWPRIDKYPRCPPALAASVKESFGVM